MDLSAHLLLFAESARVRLLVALEAEELAVGELVRVMQLPQSTVSRHLKALRQAGWIRRRAEGTAGLFRASTASDGGAKERIWSAVSDAHRTSNQFSEDHARLAAVIAARRTDSRSFFGQKHAEWDGLRDRLYGRDLWLPTLLSLLPGDQVVADLGCGTGEALEMLSPVTSRVIGVDREPAMVAAAAVRCQGLHNVALRTGGLEDLPLQEAEVDLALAMLVLHHVPDLDAVFRELRRVIRPGARVVVLDMMAHDRADWAESMGHVHLGFSRDQLQQLAATAGLRLLRWTLVAPAPDAEGPPLFVATIGR